MSVAYGLGRPGRAGVVGLVDERRERGCVALTGIVVADRPGHRPARAASTEVSSLAGDVVALGVRLAAGPAEVLRPRRAVHRRSDQRDLVAWDGACQPRRGDRPRGTPHRRSSTVRSRSGVAHESGSPRTRAGVDAIVVVRRRPCSSRRQAMPRLPPYSAVADTRRATSRRRSSSRTRSQVSGWYRQPPAM